MSRRYVDIVFMQDGRDVVDRLTRTDGVVMRGATDATIGETIEYLAQWDYGDEDNVRDEMPTGTHDEVVERDGYILTWNAGLGYVGLLRPITN